MFLAGLLSETQELESSFLVLCYHLVPEKKQSNQIIQVWFVQFITSFVIDKFTIFFNSSHSLYKRDLCGPKCKCSSFSFWQKKKMHFVNNSLQKPYVNFSTFLPLAKLYSPICKCLCTLCQNWYIKAGIRVTLDGDSRTSQGTLGTYTHTHTSISKETSPTCLPVCFWTVGWNWWLYKWMDNMVPFTPIVCFQSLLWAELGVTILWKLEPEFAQIWLYR